MIGFELIVLVTVCSLLRVNSEETKIGTGHPDETSRIMFPNDFLLENYQRHHHHIEDPRRSRTPYSGILPRREEELRPGDDEEDYNDELTNYYKNSSSNKIPLDFIMDINKYNVSDLLLNFVEGDTDYEDIFVQNRFGEDYEARSAAVTPKAAGCTPELKTVSLATTDDPSILYIPQCTKVERCGGCCSHDLLSCQPQEIETLTFKVTKTQYKPDTRKLKYVGKEIVTVEKHNKCKCDCKIKEENCNKYQEYRPSLCRCICTNSDEETKCYKSSKKLWNSELCACQCREVLQCSTGYYFDQIECKCMPNPKRRFANYNRRGYVPESEPVPPLPVDD
ncbi:uncharacterized protein LOC108905450 isoform X2 [Anoplophora glabripennis]|uniref:uncharacterized protein LOC108905450 isoform X2 n=1 Tax=Anoplophora glabripennis TaxID=217634 RepID=UPI0008745503|nr:uncharacterized protein LOC108905450 isoform X2 [Anoplophora glabripennis]